MLELSRRRGCFRDAQHAVPAPVADVAEQVRAPGAALVHEELLGAQLPRQRPRLELILASAWQHCAKPLGKVWPVSGCIGKNLERCRSLQKL